MVTKRQHDIFREKRNYSCTAYCEFDANLQLDQTQTTDDHRESVAPRLTALQQTARMVPLPAAWRLGAADSMEPPDPPPKKIS